MTLTGCVRGMVVAAAVAMAAHGALGAVGKHCDAKAYGAKGDGVTKDTKAIQAALDACAGGGTTQIAGGTFLSGPLVLNNGVTLEIAKGTTLLASPDMADYPMVTFARMPTRQPFVSAVNVENVAIIGEGTIDGNGKVWWDYVQGAKNGGVLGNDHPRPMGVVFDHTKHVRMEGVTMQNAGFWQIVPYYADDLVFRNIRVLAPKSPNTDGIDPFSSSHIVIDHVFMSNGDDNIAIKSGAIDSPGPDAPSTDITITDCTFENGHGLSIGSEIAGGAQNIHAERIHFKGTDQGIRIKANRDRGSDVSNITFKDIDMVDVRTSILISEYYPKAMPEGAVEAAPVQRLTPHFHNIRIENVKSVNSKWAGVIVGLPESPVVDIELKNVDIQAAKGMQVGYADVKMVHVKIVAADGTTITKGVGGTVVETQ